MGRIRLTKSVFMIISVVLLTPIATLLQPAAPVHADPGWVIETVDSDNYTGRYSSLALDSNGNPHISYYQTFNGNLKYASYNGTAWNREIVDSAGNVGLYTSLAIDSNDHPHISYYDMGNGNLKYASDNGTGWNIVTVDSAGTVGKFSSLALDSNGRPRIAYFLDHTTDPYLKYASYNGATWDIEDARRVGAWYISLALDSLEYPHISFHNTNTKDLRYISDNGTDWNVENPDSSEIIYTSLAIDKSDRAHISYTTFNSRDLRYVSDNGSGWNIETIDSEGSVGHYPSLKLDNDDHPHISYFDNTNGHLKYASDNGTAWNMVTVDYADRVGDDTSLALDTNGYPHISYYREISLIAPEQGNLKYARFVPAPGLAVSKGGSSTVMAGDNTTYWVSISNTGDVPLNRVIISDNRSGVVTDISGMFSATLDVGASENRTYTYTTQAADPNPLVNTVTAVYGGAGFSNLTVSDNHSLTLLHPSISVSKGGPAISKVGDNATYWAAVTNTGDCTLSKDTVSDSLVASINSQFAATLNSGVTENRTYTYTVQAGDPDPLLNTVTGLYYVPGYSNVITDNASWSVDLVHPNIMVTKVVAAGTYRAGDNITYLVSVKNTSADITLVKDSINDSLAGNITGFFGSTIAPGASDNRTYTYPVKTTDPDPLSNFVTVHYHPQGLPNDITDNTSATVFLAPSITSVAPDQGNQTQTLNVVIAGSQFDRVNAADFGAGITVNSVTVDNPAQITVSISIDAAAAPGSRDVTVSNPNGSDVLTGGFTVQQPDQRASVNSVTGTGTVTFVTSNGSITGLTAMAQSALACTGSPNPGATFPQGFFSFNIINIAPGSTVTITITFPSTMPLDTQYWKCINGRWVNCASILGDNDGDNVLTLAITDGGPGDSNPVPDGQIIDPGGPAVATVVTTTTTPTGISTGPSSSSAAAAASTSQAPVSLPNIFVRSATLSNARVSPGATVSVNADVVNRGTVNGSGRIKLYVNGEEDSNQGITLESGGSRQVYFTVNRSQPGTYSVYVNGIHAGIFVVKDVVDPDIVLSMSCLLILSSLLGFAYIAWRQRYSY